MKNDKIRGLKEDKRECAKDLVKLLVKICLYCRDMLF